MKPELPWQAERLNDLMNLQHADAIRWCIKDIIPRLWEVPLKRKNQRVSLSERSDEDYVSRRFALTRTSYLYYMRFTDHRILPTSQLTTQRSRLPQLEVCGSLHGQNPYRHDELGFLILPSGFIIPDNGDSTAQQQISSRQALDIYGFLLDTQELLENW